MSLSSIGTMHVSLIPLGMGFNIPKTLFCSPFAKRLLIIIVGDWKDNEHF